MKELTAKQQELLEMIIAAKLTDDEKDKLIAAARQISARRKGGDVED